ncbi:MAG TPA: FtsX-like permease family protein [Candidatus Microsaccharimonas sp.]|jgi:putative ABC transport system permease protein
MNVVTRGVKNAIRSPLKSGAIILMFAVSIALILSMLVARGSVIAKINDVKSTTGTAITISPAGIQGGLGGGDPLTTAQIATIKSTPNVSAITSTLTDQMTTSDTNLASSLSLGSFGRRQARSDTSTATSSSTPPDMTGTETSRPAPTPRISVTGTTNPNSISTDGSDLKLTSGSTIDGNSTSLVALVGSSLATKNNLSVGSTFTAYGQTITVSGIYSIGNVFQDSGMILPLSTVQTLTGQAGAVSSVNATVNSSDNVSSTVTALKASLGDKADITSQAETAAASVTSLEGIANLTLAGVIGAAVAGGLIIVLAMFLVVRERRREIGVIKAIGGSSSKVIAQFTIEGLTLTVLGAVIGLVLGIFVSGPMTTSLVTSSQSSANTAVTSQGRPGPGGGFGQAFRGGAAQLGTNLTQVKASLTPQIFLSAIGITVLIALLGSAIPAWLTSRVRPAEVLRTE